MAKMKKIYLLFFPVFFAALSSIGQDMKESWARTAGGSGEDLGTSIAVDHNGGVYVAGTFTSPVFSIGTVNLTNAGGKDIFIAKYDTAGNFLWAQRYGGSGNESVKKIVLSVDGSIYLTDSFSTSFTLGTNTFTPTSFSNTYLAKFSNAGVFQWAKQIAGSTVNPDIVTDQTGALYFVAETGTAIGNSSNLLFQKYAANGTVLFSNTVTSGYYMGSLLPHIAVDWSNYIHIDFYHGLTYQTVNWYDAAGNQLGSRSSYGVPRDYGRSYKARSVSDYYASSEYILLSGSRSIELHQNTQAAPSFGGCTKFALNTDIDDMGNQFLIGYITDSTTVQPCVGGASLFSGNYSIQGTTGWDIFFTRKNAADINYLASTKGAGNTNEYPSQMVIDTGGHAMYVIASWSKRADTSKFRFGNSILTHSTPGTYNKDILLLKLQNPSVALLAHAGYDAAICVGGTTQLSGSANGGAGNFIYSWSPSTGLSNPYIANPVAFPTVSTTYVLTVTDAAGTVAKDSVRVIISPALYKPVISLGSGGKNPFCEGEFVILLADNAVSYLWSNGSTNNGIMVSKSDTVTVTAVNNQGCTGTSDPYIAIMKSRPAPPVITPAGNAQNNVQACSGSTVTLTAQSMQSPVTYLWNTGANTSSITPPTTGVFWASVTGANGCTSLNTIRGVVLYNQPTGTVVANGNTTLCSGDSVQLTVNTADTTTVLWNTGATAKTIWVKTAGVYTAQLTTAQGCTKPASNSITIQVNQRPAPVITQTGNTLSATPAASYQWYLNNSIIAGAVSQTLNITSGGNYKVVVTDANGCTGTAAIGAILRLSNPALTYQIYPNPAKDKIEIVYSLQQSERVSITIRNAQGISLYTLVDGQQQAAGNHQYRVNTNLLVKGLVIIEFCIGDKTVAHKQVIL
jgi:hypothetical protein